MTEFYKKTALSTFKCLMFFFLTGLAHHAWAGQDVSLEIKTPVNQLTFGDSLVVTCIVKNPQNLSVSAPHPGNESDYFDISNPFEDSTASVTGTKTYSFLVYCFSPDTLSLGPSAVDYKTARGDSVTAFSNQILIPVKSAVDSASANPFPNRMPMDIAYKGIPFWLWILLALLIGVCAYLLIKYLRKRRKAIVPQVPITPEDEIGEFEKLRGQELEVKELYFIISTLLRSFIHHKLGFDAVFETTDEILKNLYKKYDNIQNADLLKAILIESDTVKFAKFIPGQELRSTIIDRALFPVKSILEEIRIKKEMELLAQQQTTEVRSSQPAAEKSEG